MQVFLNDWGSAVALRATTRPAGALTFFPDAILDLISTGSTTYMAEAWHDLEMLVKVGITSLSDSCSFR